MPFHGLDAQRIARAVTLFALSECVEVVKGRIPEVEREESITWVRQIFSFNFSAPNPCDRPNVRNGRGRNVEKKKKNQKGVRRGEE